MRRHSPLGDLSVRLDCAGSVARRAGDRSGRLYGPHSLAGAPRPRRRRARERAHSDVRERLRAVVQRRHGSPAGECLAERVGFEPTVLSHTAFRERHLQPLGHLSAREDTSGLPSSCRGARTFRSDLRPTQPIHRYAARCAPGARMAEAPRLVERGRVGDGVLRADDVSSGANLTERSMGRALGRCREREARPAVRAGRKPRRALRPRRGGCR